MNIWQDLKERKILDKDGKVDALGPMGKSKLSGKEVSAYFRKYKVKDPEIRKAVEVALDLGGAMDVAGKEIQKFYGRKVRNSKEVKFALKYANESYEINEGKSLKQLFRMFKKDIKNYNNNKDLSQDAAMAFAYWAIKNGEIKTDDPDEFDQWLDNNLPEGAEPFLDQLVKIQFNSSDPEKAEKMLKAAAKKGLLGYNGPMKHGGIVGNDSFIVVGKEKDVDKVLNSMRKIMSTGRRLMNMPKLSLIQYNSFDYGDGKTLMEASAFAVMQDIVKNKQAQKIKGTMVDMFTASVVVKAYDKVNDSNKKKIEKAPLETLVKLAHKVMGMKEEDEQNEWISKDGARRRVAEKDQRKDVKEGDDSLGAKKFQNPLKKKGYPYQEQVNVLDTFRNMREAIDLEEVKSILQKDIKGLKHISDIEIRFSDEKEWKRMSAFVKRELKKPAYKGIKSKDVYYSPDPLQIGFGAGKGNSKINIKPIVDIIVQQTKDPKTRLKSLYEAKKPSKMGGSKLTGQEISVYFRKNPKAKSNAMVKKAVEIALDHGGAMNYAIDKIEKLKRGLSKNKDVAKALNYANFGENNEEIKPYYKGFELVMQEALSRADQIKLASFGTTLSKITGFKWEKDKDPEVAMDRLFGQIRSKGKYSPANWERIHKMVGLLDKIGVKLPSLKGFYMGWDKKTGKGLFHEEIESIKEGIEEIVEAQTMSDADIKKIAGMTDRNDHNGSMMHLAKALKNKKAQEIMASLMKIHKSMGHMPAGGVQIRNDLMKILMSDAKKKYRNHADIYSAF